MLPRVHTLLPNSAIIFKKNNGNRKYKQSVMALLSCATLRMLLSKNLLGHVCLFAGLLMSSRWITFLKLLRNRATCIAGLARIRV